MNSVEQKTCSSCGEGFTCGAEGGDERCWCVALPHLPLAAISGRDCFCPKCLTDSIQRALDPGAPAVDSAHGSVRRALAQQEGPISTQLEPQRLLLEGEDYYSEDGLIVFTASYHRRRGYCCERACRHCPYKG